MSTNYFKSGVWNTVCDQCGRKRKSDEVRKRWDGFIVCSDTCWEPRHSLDFIRGRPDPQSVPFNRHEASDTFIPMNFTQQPIDLVPVEEVVSVDFGTSQSDTVSFSESIVIGWLATLSDSVTITELISVALIQPNPLNAFALNTKPLG